MKLVKIDKVLSKTENALNMYKHRYGRSNLYTNVRTLHSNRKKETSFNVKNTTYVEVTKTRHTKRIIASFTLNGTSIAQHEHYYTHMSEEIKQKVDRIRDEFNKTAEETWKIPIPIEPDLFENFEEEDDYEDDEEDEGLAW